MIIFLSLFFFNRVLFLNTLLKCRSLLVLDCQCTKRKLIICSEYCVLPLSPNPFSFLACTLFVPGTSLYPVYCLGPLSLGAPKRSTTLQKYSNTFLVNSYLASRPRSNPTSTLALSPSFWGGLERQWRSYLHDVSWWRFSEETLAAKKPVSTNHNVVLHECFLQVGVAIRVSLYAAYDPNMKEYFPRGRTYPQPQPHEGLEVGRGVSRGSTACFGGVLS